MIAFPTKRLYAKDLIATFAKMTQLKNYNKVVFYLEVFLDIFRHASQDQCSKIFLKTPKFMDCQQLILVNHLGDVTVVQMMLLMDNISNPALEIFSQSTILKTPIKEILTKP